MTKHYHICLMLLIATLFLSPVNILAEDNERDAQPPPEIVIDAPPPTQSPVKQENYETETITIYDSKVLPGFRPCTTKDYQNSDIDPVACEDDDRSSDYFNTRKK